VHKNYCSSRVFSGRLKTYRMDGAGQPNRNSVGIDYVNIAKMHNMLASVTSIICS